MQSDSAQRAARATAYPRSRSQGVRPPVRYDYDSGHPVPHAGPGHGATLDPGRLETLCGDLGE
jgi:hypothetical protein